MNKRISFLFIIFIIFFSMPINTVYAKDFSIPVAVIDTGVSGSIVENVKEGYNYVYDNTDCHDLLGHGTAVAWLIKSVCPEAAIIPLVYYTKNTENETISGGATALVKAIYDAVDKYGCKIINISSGTYKDIPELKTAVEYAASKGVLVVASSGNRQEELAGLIYYPAGYDAAISVGACDKYGDPAPFSQLNATVDILDIGVDLKTKKLTGASSLVSGTSYATAVITGRLCNILKENPYLNAEEAKERLLKKARLVGSNLVFADFKDVKDSDYFYSPVSYAVDNGITKGTSDYYFSPSKVCTKGEILTFIYRAAGYDTDGNIPFYADALKWASSYGIHCDDPNSPCTRLDAVQYLYAAYGNTLKNSVSPHEDTAFFDVSDISVSWAVKNGITKGTGNSTFSPEKTCTRAEIVTFLYRVH